MSGGGAIVVGGIRLVYDESGRPESPPMVLLHALGERGSDWATVRARFSESFHVLTIDLRGHGDSDWPGIYSFKAMRDDVIGVLEQLGLGPTILVGHSMGGVVAYLVAMQRPDLVERLVVEDVPPPYEREHPIPERPQDVEALMFDWAVVPAIVGEVNAGSPEAWDGLAKITAPTLLIGGGAESHIPQDKLIEAADRIQRCDIVTIAAGHHVYSSRPSQFANAVLSWIHR